MSQTCPKNLSFYSSHVLREDRERLHQHKGAAVWFTGLPASGKSTISHQLEKQLHDMGCSTYVLDGDNVRHGLCSDLGFSPEDRTENIRRIGEMVRLFVDAGLIAICAFVSPYRADLDGIREIIGRDRFFEVYVHCPPGICVSRDRKGIYTNAAAGLINEFTGISAPYEPPLNPALGLDSSRLSPPEAAARVVALLRERASLHERRAEDG